jgi:putative endonuclease
VRRDAQPTSSDRAPAPSRTYDRRRLGLLGEDLAAAHLQRLGFTVLARNVRTRHGEIDLIVFDGRTLVFAEVKTRRAPHRQERSAAHLEPLASLRPRQRLRLRRLAVAWLSATPPKGRPGGRPAAHTIRFDAIGVVLDADGALARLDHVEGAW